MSRKQRQRVEEIEEVVEAAPRAHSLNAWIERADAELYAERARQLEFSHREGTLAQIVKAYGAPMRPDECGDLTEVDDFLAFGILGPMAVEATRHAKLDVGEPAMRAAAARAEAAKRGDGSSKAQAPAAIAKPVRPRHDDPRVRFGSELEALRAMRAAQYTNRSGAAARAIAKIQLGATIQGLATNREPIPDPYIDAVAKALAKLDPLDAEMLEATYIELTPPRNKLDEVVASASAVSIAAAVRENEGELPSWSKLRKGPHITAALLVAERLGRVDPDDEEQQAGVAKEIHGRVSRARKAFRRALQAFDFHPEPEPITGETEDQFRRRVVQWSAEINEVGPRWVIPPPTTRERTQDADAGRGCIECCGGAPIHGGVRAECSTVSVWGPAGALHQSNAWPICEWCTLPRVMGATE